MSMIAVPAAVQDLIDRGVVDTADLEGELAAQWSDTPVYSALTGDQKDALLAGSGLGPEARSRVREDWENPEQSATRAWLGSVADRVKLTASSATVQQVADRLQVNPSTVTRWHAKGAILGFTGPKGTLRLPLWQFTTTGILPGWDKIASRTAGLPLTVLGSLLHTRQDELHGQTPYEWLAGGGSPAPVGDLVDSLQTW